MTPSRIEPTSEELDLVRSGTLSAGRIASKIGRHVSVVERWAREAGNVLPDQHAHRVHTRFFREWSHDMAYILGFIAADGCVRRLSDTNGSLEIGLSAKDRVLLEAIRVTMGIERRIYDRVPRSGHPRSTLGVGSIQLVDDLIELGIKPRKSEILEWPHQLPTAYVSQFVLGYFDGDGTVAVYRNHNHGHRYDRLRIRFVGTYAFLEGLADTVLDHVGWLGSMSCDRRSPNLWTLAYIGSAAEAVGGWMYREASAPLYLVRKRSIIDDYLATPKMREHRKGRLSYDDALEIRQAWATGEFSQAQLGDRYGVTASNISAIVNGKSFRTRHLVRT